jgi:hypothetical protein
MTTLRELFANAKSYSDGIEFLAFSRFCRTARTETDFRYGHDFDDKKGPEGADVVGHSALTGSDYSGGTVVRANRRAVRELLGEDSPLIVTAHGGYNTEAIYFRLDVADEHVAEVFELLEGLNDYPSVDDSVLSELESEEESEGWESYGADDFLRSLESRYRLERGDVSISKVYLGFLFQRADGGSGLVVHEESPGPYFDTDRAAEKTPAAFLFYLGTFEGQGAEENMQLGMESPDECRRLLRLIRIGNTLRALATALGGSAWGARQRILNAKIDSGDETAELSAETLENKILRSFRLTFERWAGGKPETLSLDFDPFDTGASVLDSVPKIQALFSK